MLNRTVLLIGAFLLFSAPAKTIALIDCNVGCGGIDCTQLFTYVNKCQKCKRPKAACTKAFCQNHPILCHEGKPLSPLSINTMAMTPDGETALDICIAPLFSDIGFSPMRNKDVTIMNLNGLDFQFFSETKDYQRKLGTLRNNVANYLHYIGDQKKQISTKALGAYVDKWITTKAKKPLDKLSDLDMHTLIDVIREDIYKKKGVPIQKKDVAFKNQRLTLHVSKMGCIGEK